MKLFKKYNIISSLLVRISFLFSEETFLKLLYRVCMHKRLNLDNPISFTEKLQWLKLYNRNSLYPSLVDKFEVKSYVSDLIGDKYVIPTIGIWNNFDEIDFSKLPNQFVLKTTNGGGSSGVVICKDKNKFNIPSAKKKLEKSMFSKLNMGEWPYKQIKPRIIAEQFIEDKGTGDLRDYKFFCFNGEVKLYKIDFDRLSNHKANYYDNNNRLLPFGEIVCPPDPGKIIIIPDNMKSMIQIASRLAKEFPFIRIDLYNVDGAVYFGEFTFFPDSGLGLFTDDSWDCKLGEWIDLNLIKRQ